MKIIDKLILNGIDVSYKKILVNGKQVSHITTNEEEYTLPDYFLSFNSSGLVTGIGDSVRSDIVIPEYVIVDETIITVTVIGNRAFNSCSSLTSVIIPNSVTTIGDDAFLNCTSLTSVYYMGDIASWCAINFSEEGPLSNGADLYINNEKVVDLVIPNGVETISDCAFAGCTSLTSVTIPDSVTTIGSVAFRNCTSLTSVTIPDSITVIGWSTFNSCSNLNSVTIPDSVTIISGYAFYGCYGLTSVTIPDSVTKVLMYAFGNCSNLTSITFKGTRAQWKAIEKGSNWNSSVPAKKVRCRDGEVEL